MKLDAHQHFWKYDPEIYHWIDDSMAEIRSDFTPSDLQPVLTKNEIEGCIAVQADQSERDTEFLLKLASEHDFIKAVVGWMDLKAENLEERLAFFSRNALLKGIRHTVYDQEGEFMADPDFRNGIAKLGNFDLTYDLLVFEYQLAGAIKLVKNFPNQVFVLDHMGKPNISSNGPSEFWRRNIEEIAKNDHVFCKLSGIFTQVPDFKWHEALFTPYLDVVVENFGVNRIMFGSDWPVSLTAASYEDTLGILENYFEEYSLEEKERIFGANAAECYSINFNK